VTNAHNIPWRKSPLSAAGAILRNWLGPQPLLQLVILAAVVGFVLERGEDWRLLLWLPLQRFGYRQIMYYVVLRSLWTALRGPFVGWGKLERHGTVKARA